MADLPHISIVIPLYNEEESLPELHAWIGRVLQDYPYTYEILFIDDGSKDNSWTIVQQLAEKDERVKGYKLNRNYGKSAALQTGFKHAKGHVAITMDADLQDSPEEIPGLYEMVINEGYDLVSGWKKKRHDPLSKTIPSRFFNLVTRSISKIPLHDFNCGLKAYRNVVIKNINVYGEMHRYIPVICKWNGFSRIGEKVVNHQSRKYGKTKYGLERFIHGFLDLLSVTFVSKFSRNPMHFFGTMGTLSFVGGAILALYIILRKMWGIYHHIAYRDVTDQPLFYLSLVALILGVQLFLAGFLAELHTMHAQRESSHPVIETAGNVS